MSPPSSITRTLRVNLNFQFLTSLSCLSPPLNLSPCIDRSRDRVRDSEREREKERKGHHNKTKDAIVCECVLLRLLSIAVISLHLVYFVWFGLSVLSKGQEYHEP